MLCLMWWISHTEVGCYANVVGYVLDVVVTSCRGGFSRVLSIFRRSLESAHSAVVSKKYKMLLSVMFNYYVFVSYYF